MKPDYILISRRKLIRNFILGISVSATGYGCNYYTQNDYNDIAERLLKLLLKPKLAKKLGAEYLSAEPALKYLSLNQFVLLLCEHINLSITEALSISPNKFATIFSVQVQNDFSEGNVVLVWGWVLSQLESRLCTFYLLHDLSSNKDNS